MKPFNYSVLKNGKEEKVKHFGGRASAFDSGNTGGHKKSKHHLDLRKKALTLMKGKGREGSMEHKATGLRNTRKLLD